MDIKPLDITVSRAAIKGNVYHIYDYDQYYQEQNPPAKSAIKYKRHGKEMIIPVKGDYKEQQMPGVYDAGPITYTVFPTEMEEDQYVPEKIVNISNRDSAKDIYLKQQEISKLTEPWITNPDNVTRFPIHPDDQPEMVGLKMAMNEKGIDFDQYGSRFGQNFPNDKRQMKNHSATLTIIKRFCKNLDMKAKLIFTDKNDDVLNPIGKEIEVVLTDEGEE